MTSRTPFSFACGAYDRMDALRSGETKLLGIDLNLLTISYPRDFFDRSMGGHELDTSEMSASEYICTYTKYGNQDFVAIPIFLSRVFRHGFIAVDANQVQSPKDLEEKKVGGRCTP